MLPAVAQGLKSSHFKCPSSDGSRQVPGEDHHTVLTGMAGAAGKHGFWGVQVIRLAYLGSKLFFFFFQIHETISLAHARILASQLMKGSFPMPP